MLNRKTVISKKSSMTPQIATVPEDLWIKLFDYLGLIELLRFARTLCASEHETKLW